MKERIKGEPRRGSALVVTAVMVAGLGTLSLALLSSVSSSGQLDKKVRKEVASRYIAEAGLSEAYHDLLSGGTGDLGEAQQRVGYASGEYWVEREDLGNGRVALVSTAIDGRAASRVRLILEGSTNGSNPWRFAAFGDEGMTMDSNARVDSYDSRLGLYTDQDNNGNGNDKHALENGPVGSNQDIGLQTNAHVWGDAVPGPTGSATITGNAIVEGSTTSGSDVVNLPAVDVPVIASMGSYTVSGSETLAPGDYHFDALHIDSGDLTIVGPARVVLDEATLDSNTELWVDGSNGAVEFFVLEDFILNQNTSFAALDYDPTALTLNLLSNNIEDPDSYVDLDEVDFESNAEFHGKLYAPNARIEINSNFQLFGAMVARQVHLDSNSRVHFDEALMDVEEEEEETVSYDRLAWNELAVSYGEIPK